MSAALDRVRPCYGKNANVCVAEGCYGDDCLTREALAHRLAAAEATIARVRALCDGRREWGPGQDIEPFRLREALIGPNPDTYDPRCGGCETCELQP
jgi:hypothetical protein